MRHKVSGRKFSRTAGHRRALLRNMATSLLRYEAYETTVQKAKDLRRVVEKLITLGRKDTLANRKLALSYIIDKQVVHKLFAELGPRYQGRPGGYTRVLRTRTRHGDAAEMAHISLVHEESSKKGQAKKTRTRKAAAAAESAPETTSTEG